MKKALVLGFLGLWLLAGTGVAGEAVAAAARFNLKDDFSGAQTVGLEGDEGTSNTFYGLDAGNLTLSGGSNSFFGRYAGNSTTTGYFNTFVGRAAGRNNTTGYNNVFIGAQTGNRNTSGRKNVFVGVSNGTANAAGTQNVFVGGDCGTVNENGCSNTFLGFGAGYSSVDASYNTYLGEKAGYFNVHGEDNTFVGVLAGYNNPGSGNVFLGNNAGRGEYGSNRLYIDNANDPVPLIWGNFEDETLNFNANVRIRKADSVMNPTHLIDVGQSGAYCNGGDWVNGSSRDVKEDITALTSEEARLAFEALEPVKFRYKDDRDETCLGFIAEDVPDLVATNDRKGLSAMDLIATLTKVVQEQQKAIAELRAEVARLKAAEKES